VDEDEQKTLETHEEEEGTYFLKIKCRKLCRQNCSFRLILMKPGISRLNVMTVFIIDMMTTILLFLRTSMISYLLVYDYGMSRHDSGLYAAKLGWYNDIAMIPAEFIQGVISDTFGRKKLMVGSMFLCGTMIILETFFSKFWPWLVVLHITFGMALLPILLSPLQADYLSPNTMGASCAVDSLFSLLG